MSKASRVRLQKFRRFHQIFAVLILVTCIFAIASIGYGQQAPLIVLTSPVSGSSDVDPAIKEISVTFDRDMSMGGFSWTGGGEMFPVIPEGMKPFWRDARTCVLPVALVPGHAYRVGINAPSFKNFRSAQGVPVTPSAITFTTKGAANPGGMTMPPSTASGAPQIVSTSPVNGSADVDPATKEISVIFDRDMNMGGFSWTGGGVQFPKIPEGTKPFWRDARTCVLPVALESGHPYRVGINAPSFKNFRSAQGIPVEPSAIVFTTKGTLSAESAAQLAVPQIVTIAPANGAVGIPSSTSEISVTFNMPMGAGCSWTGGGPLFPTIPEGKKPSWSLDKKTCTLPVKLLPNWKYQMGLNSPSFKNFASESGVALEPVKYSFATGQ